jgi:hypothetical protein
MSLNGGWCHLNRSDDGFSEPPSRVVIEEAGLAAISKSPSIVKLAGGGQVEGRL